MRSPSSHRVAYDDGDDDGGELNHQNKILLSFPEKLTYGAGGRPMMWAMSIEETPRMVPII